MESGPWMKSRTGPIPNLLSCENLILWPKPKVHVRLWLISLVHFLESCHNRDLTFLEVFLSWSKYFDPIRSLAKLSSVYNIFHVSLAIKAILRSQWLLIPSPSLDFGRKVWAWPTKCSLFFPSVSSKRKLLQVLSSSFNMDLGSMPPACNKRLWCLWLIW